MRGQVVTTTQPLLAGFSPKMARICGGGVSSVDAMQIAMREPGHEEVVGRIKTWE